MFGTWEACMRRNDRCVIGSADACANIERSGRRVNCGVVRLRRRDSMYVDRADEVK
jgi:hypothetical protein